MRKEIIINYFLHIIKMTFFKYSHYSLQDSDIDQSEKSVQLSRSKLDKSKVKWIVMRTSRLS